MKKLDLTNAVDTRIETVKDALQTVVDAMNHGQKKQIVKKDNVKALFDLYGVEYEEG